MNPINLTSRPSTAAAGPSTEPSPSAGPRTSRGAKSFPPLVTGNRAYIRAWAARRAKLLAAPKVRSTP